MTSFYLTYLPKCNCGKPATHGVQASGNVDYVKAACEPCAKRRLKELRSYYAGIENEEKAWQKLKMETKT